MNLMYLVPLCGSVQVKSLLCAVVSTAWTSNVYTIAQFTATKCFDVSVNVPDVKTRQTSGLFLWPVVQCCISGQFVV